MSTYAIIYRIYNIHNMKSYIGKTKSRYGKKDFGGNCRFKQHLVNAFSPSKYDDCPLLYNAIRKYGKESFKLEILLECNLESANMFEIQMIKIYGSTNRKFGYNISSGGDGRSIVNVKEETRKKISSRNIDENEFLNIIPYVDKNNQHIGYKVRRREKGIQIQKMFANKKFTLQENLKKAKEYLDSILNKNEENNKYNRIFNLPKNISYYRDRKTKEPIGYKVNIIIDGKTHSKTICKNNISMEEKFKIALDYKEQLYKTYVKITKTSSKEDRDNPQPST